MLSKWEMSNILFGRWFLSFSREVILPLDHCQQSQKENHRKKRTRSSIQSKKCIQNINLCLCVHVHGLFTNRFKFSAKLCALFLCAVQWTSRVMRSLLRGTDICRFLFLPSVLLSSVRIKHLQVQTQLLSIVSAQRLICVEGMDLCFLMNSAEGVWIS